jgi:hypothetical protein
MKGPGRGSVNESDLAVLVYLTYRPIYRPIVQFSAAHHIIEDGSCVYCRRTMSRARLFFDL